jgi:hypothetical protein
MGRENTSTVIEGFLNEALSRAGVTAAFRSVFVASLCNPRNSAYRRSKFEKTDYQFK